MRRTLFWLLLTALFPLGAVAAETAPPPAPDPALLRYLNIRGTGAARFSADGAQLAFTASWTGTGQKWVIPSKGGFPQQITYFEDNLDFCDFTPHNPDLMLLGVASGGNERTQLYFVRPDGTGLREFLVNPAVIHRAGRLSRDGSLFSYAANSRQEQFFDVYVARLDFDGNLQGAPEMALSLDSSLSAGSFSPDGRMLIASDFKSNVDNNVYLINVATKQKVLLTPHTGEASFGEFNWADDSTLYFACNENREFAGLAMMRLPGFEELWGAPDAFAPQYVYEHAPDYDVDGVVVSWDGRSIGWTENVDGFAVAQLAALPGLNPLTGAGGSPLPAPVIPAGIQWVGQFDRLNERVLVGGVGSSGPNNIFSYDLRSGATTQLTWSSLGGLDAGTFIEPQVVRITSFDGLELSALWYEPRGVKPAGGWPVIIEAHGGPESQSRPYFDSRAQLYLSKGVGLLEPNPRGSAGYGKTFMTLDNVALREDSVSDYVAARDWLVEAGLADPGRIAISGGSYGGYVVLAALTLYPDKWAAGVDVVGISNFVTFLENTGVYRRSIREAEYGSLERDRELLERISPIHKVDSITAPLLIIHGTNDPRVPVGEAQQMYDALQARGREVDLLVFPDEGHGVVKLTNRAVAWARELDFLSRHLGMDEGLGAAAMPEQGAVMEQSAAQAVSVIFETTQGSFTVAVHPDWSPSGAARFLELARLGFYDGAPFFRVIDGFVAQFGISAKPELNERWGEDFIKDEPVLQSNTRGYLSFATSGPDTRSAQLFINYADNAFLDGMGFTPFAVVTAGLDVADSVFRCEHGDQPGLAQAGGLDEFKAAYPEADYIVKVTVIE